MARYTMTITQRIEHYWTRPESVQPDAPIVSSANSLKQVQKQVNEFSRNWSRNLIDKPNLVTFRASYALGYTSFTPKSLFTYSGKFSAPIVSFAALYHDDSTRQRFHIVYDVSVIRHY